MSSDSVQLSSLSTAYKPCNLINYLACNSVSKVGEGTRDSERNKQSPIKGCISYPPEVIDRLKTIDITGHTKEFFFFAGFPSKMTNQKKVSRSLNRLTEEVQLAKREACCLSTSHSIKDQSKTSFPEIKDQQTTPKKMSEDKKTLAKAPSTDASNEELVTVPVLEIFNRKDIEELTKYAG